MILLPCGGVKAFGKENVPKEGPVILAPNHVSWFDPPCMSATSPRLITFMPKKELFEKGIVGFVMRGIEGIPVNRTGNDTSAVREAFRRLDIGECLLIFPEGTRGDGITLGRIEPGLAMMARKSDAAVVPIGIGGTETALGRGKKLRRHKMKVIYGKPIRFSDFKDAGKPKDQKAAFEAEYLKRLLELTSEAGLDLKTGDCS